jgi:hypothetical protein
MFPLFCSGAHHYKNRVPRCLASAKMVFRKRVSRRFESSRSQSLLVL